MTIEERAIKAVKLKTTGGYNCSQAVTAALADQTNLTEEQLKHITAGFCAGMGGVFTWFRYAIYVLGFAGLVLTVHIFPVMAAFDGYSNTAAFLGKDSVLLYKQKEMCKRWHHQNYQIVRNKDLFQQQLHFP